MANRYYSFGDQEYYHVYNRGNSKQVIFNTESDYDRFLNLLYIANNTDRFVFREIEEEIYSRERNKKLVHIGAYCLMPNHFHLLLTPAQEGGIERFMLKLGTAYSSYFNKKYFRVGSLFEGSYQARHADSDRYLKYLFAYIHLNPFRSKNHEAIHIPSVNELRNFQYSSLPDYLGTQRPSGNIIDPQVYPQYFAAAEDHLRELTEWLDYQEI